MTEINWKVLDHPDTLKEITPKSFETPVIIYKHSTRCSLSSMVLSRLERSWDQNEIPAVEAFFLDLISYREISNAVAQHFQVYHESPQVLIIVDGNCIFNTSHMGISFKAIKAALGNVSA